MSDRHVVVIGGGITGLAAAHTLLVAPNAPSVTVIEADQRLGGKVLGTPFAGLPNVECGADMFLARTPAAVDLAGELGLGEELAAPTALPSFVWSGGHLHPLPEGLLLGTPMAIGPLVRTGLLTWKGKARAALEPFLPRYDAGDALGVAVRQRFGDEVLDRLVGPLVGGINAGDPDRLSLRGVAPQVAEAMERHRSLLLGLRSQLKAQRAARASGSVPPAFLAPREGVSALIDRLHRSILDGGGRVLLGTRAEGLEPTAGGHWSVATSAASTTGRERSGPGLVEADDVIMAAPADVAGALLGPLDAEVGGTLARIAYASVAMVTLALTDDAIGRPVRASGYLVPRAEQRTVAACSWGSAKWPTWRRPGQTILRISAGRDGDDRPLHLDDADLTEAVLADLGTQIGLRGAPEEVRITRWWRALPQYAPGHVERIDAALARLAAKAPHVHAAGAAYNGLGIPACIAQGQAAARAALADANRR